LAPFDADLFVVVAYGEIIGKKLLALPKKGAINVHASLLPAYRGAAPMQRALMDGVSRTGITIIQMNERMDAGDILEKVSVEVPHDWTRGELEQKLCVLALAALRTVLEKIKKNCVQKEVQKHEEATFAPKISPEECQIDWKKPAHVLHNQIRALSPLPGAWTIIRMGSDLRRIKIKRSRLIENQAGFPGEILAQEGVSNNRLIVACGKQALELLTIQPEGKKDLSAKDFLNGVRQSLSFSVN
jgi:methionyl-tRNA formyltransferase